MHVCKTPQTAVRSRSAFFLTDHMLYSTCLLPLILTHRRVSACVCNVCNVAFFVTHNILCPTYCGMPQVSCPFYCTSHKCCCWFWRVCAGSVYVHPLLYVNVRHRRVSAYVCKLAFFPTHKMLCSRCILAFIVRHGRLSAYLYECVQILCMFTLLLHITEEFLLTFATLLFFSRKRCCDLDVLSLLLYVTEDFLLIFATMCRFCVCSPFNCDVIVRHRSISAYVWKCLEVAEVVDCSHTFDRDILYSTVHHFIVRH